MLFRSNPNRICAECELQFDLRLLPGMDIEALRTEIDARMRDALSGTGLEFERRPLFPGTPAMETRADAPIVQAAEAHCGCRASAVGFGTEGPFLSALGMDTLILGPGHIDQAHQPNEYLARSQIAPCVETLTGLIQRFCQN